MRNNHVLRLFLAVMAFSFCSAFAAADDFIITRDGSINEVKITKMTDSGISYVPPKMSNAQESHVPLSSLYMIYIDKQGPMYIKNGKRVSGENVKFDKKKNIIFLIEGGMILTDEVKLTETTVDYKPQKGFNGLIGVDKDQVFIIYRKNGIIEVINDLSEVSTPAQTTQQPQEEPQYSVEEYVVQYGDTLQSVSEKLGVSIEDLRDVNDIPSTTRDTSRLKKGTKLSYYKLIN